MYNTNKKQSKKLLEVGVDPNTADTQVSNIPSWSVGALLDLIPQSIFYENVLHFWYLSKTNNSYQIVGVGPVTNGSLIDVLFDLVHWLYENHLNK